MSKHLVNTSLLAMAMEAAVTGQPVKQAFIGAGDPALGGEQQPQQAPAASGDPSGGAAGGGAAAGGGGGADPSAIAAQVMQMLQAQGVGGQGGMMGGGMVEPIKPKIDINLEVMKLNKMVARIADSLGIQIPASELVGTSADLTQMALQQGGQGGGAGGQQQSAIQPIQPIGAAAPGMGAPAGGMGGGKTAQDTGYTFEAPAESFGSIADRARAVLAVRTMRRAG